MAGKDGTTTKVDSTQQPESTVKASSDKGESDVSEGDRTSEKVTTSGFVKDGKEENQGDSGSGNANIFDYWGTSLTSSVTSLFGGVTMEDSVDSRKGPLRDGQVGEGKGKEGIDVDGDGNKNGNGKDEGILQGAAREILGKETTHNIENASRAAQDTLGKVGEEIGTGWGNFNRFLDDMLQGNSDTKKGVTENGNENVQDKFEKRFVEELKERIIVDKDVVDCFQCKLLQKYRCYLNDVTCEKTLVVDAVLYITVSCVAMDLIESQDSSGTFGKGKGERFKVVIEFEKVEKIQRGKKESLMMRLLLKDGRCFVLGGWENEREFQGALALIEHMIDATQKGKAQAKQDKNTENGVINENGNGGSGKEADTKEKGKAEVAIEKKKEEIENKVKEKSAQKA